MAFTKQTGLAVAGGGAVGAGLLGTVGVMTHNWLIVGILLGGVLLVGLVIAGILGFLSRMEKKKKAAQMEGATSGGADTHTSDANERATLAKLRKQWEEGLEKLKKAGIDIYSKPWVLIVGPSGAGKTEAIRHAELLLKDKKLQDPLAGVGGTLNMNWWFSNDSVFLDTAGRMFLETVTPGKTSEWIEFLKLVKRARPKAPINGVLLVISAASLLVETDSQITSTSEQIAERLEDIKGTLNVRFPVYVMITKSDLIPGFRAFFEDLNDPDLQRQILGWSNPALDEPFDPEVVDEHLKVVRDRLVQRRTGLLAEKVAKLSSDAPLLDEVDELYTFPDAFLKITPRLRLYMQNIFARAGWYENSRPFVRGIFFSSAMNQGTQLDTEIANMLNVDPMKVPELAKWVSPAEQSRHLFLPQLFTKKILPEQGLVTSAKNVSKSQRIQRLVIFGSITLGLLLLVGLTVFNYFVFRDSIGRPANYWIGVENLMKTQAADGHETYDPTKLSADAVIKAGVFKPTETFTGLSEGMREIKPPKIFIGALFGGSSGEALNRQRAEAQRIVLEQTLIHPLITEAGDKLSKDIGKVFAAEIAAKPPAPRRIDSEHITPAAQVWGSFAFLWEQVENKRSSGTLPAGDVPESDLIQNLGTYVLGSPLPPAITDFNGKISAIYKGKWPTPLMTASGSGDIDAEVRPALKDAIGNFETYWNGEIEKAKTADKELLQLNEALAKLKTTEDDSLRSWASGLASVGLQMDTLAGRGQDWTKLYAAWTDAYKDVLPLAEKYKEKVSLLQAQDENVQLAKANRNDAAAILKASLKWVPDNALRTSMKLDRLDPLPINAVSTAPAIAGGMDDLFFQRLNDADHTRLFAMKNSFYQAVDSLRAADLASLAADYKKVIDTINAHDPPNSPDSLNNAARTARISAAVVTQARAYELLTGGIAKAADSQGRVTEASIRAYVNATAKAKPPAEIPTLPGIPLTAIKGGYCNLDFDPDTAATIIPNVVDVAKISDLEKLLEQNTQDFKPIFVLKTATLSQTPLLATAMQAKADYLKNYTTYWTETLRAQAMPALPKWDDYRAQLDGASTKDVAGKMQDLETLRSKALDKLQLPHSAEMQATDKTLAEKTYVLPADGVVRAWLALAGKTAPDARHEILFAYDDIQRKKLIMPGAPGDLINSYYIYLAQHAFDVLYNECRGLDGGLDAAAVTLAKFGKQYPFNKASTVDDTLEEAAAVHQALGLISAVAAPADSDEFHELWDRFTGQKPVHDGGLTNDALAVVRDRDTMLHWQKDAAGWSSGLKIQIAFDQVKDDAHPEQGFYLVVTQDKELANDKLGKQPPLQAIVRVGRGTDMTINDGIPGDPKTKKTPIPEMNTIWGTLHKLDESQANAGKADVKIPGTDFSLRLTISIVADPPK